MSGSPSQSAASGLGPFVFDGVSVGRVLLATVVALTFLYTLQLLAQGATALKGRLSHRGSDPPASPPRVLLFPRLQNMLLKVSVPLLSQAGALGVAGGREWWHHVLGGLMLALALALVAGAASAVARARRAPPEVAKLDVASAGVPGGRWAWLLGRPGVVAAWSGPFVDTHGNIFENGLDSFAAMTTTPMLLGTAFLQGAVAGSFGYLLRRPVALLLCVLGLQVASAAHICFAIPFIDPFRQKCANASSACLITASLLALFAPRAEATNTAIVVLKGIGVVVSSAASGLSFARRVLNADGLRRRIAAAIAMRKEGERGHSVSILSLPREKSERGHSESVSILNPLARDDGGDDGARCGAIMAIFDDNDEQGPGGQGDSNGDDGGAPAGDDVHEALFGGSAYTARNDTIGDTYNPLFAIACAEEDAEAGGGVLLGSGGEAGADEGGDAGAHCDPEVALSMGLMRSVVGSCKQALPQAAEAEEEASRDRALTAATDFRRRMADIVEAMGTVAGLAASNPTDLDLETSAQRAALAVSLLAEGPGASTAAGAASDVAALLDMCSEVCRRLGVRASAPLRLGDSGEDGRPFSALEALRSMLSAAKTQLKSVLLIDRDEREDLYRRRMLEERAREEGRLGELKGMLRSARIAAEQ